jgi:hypothetical protein
VDQWIRRWEGWVLGQTALPVNWPLAAGATEHKMTEHKKNWRARKDAPKVAFGNALGVTSGKMF